MYAAHVVSLGGQQALVWKRRIQLCYVCKVSL